MVASTQSDAHEWHLVLRDDIIIPAGGARAFFQDGRQVGRVDLYHPHCELEIDTVNERPQRLHADRFFVTRRTERVISDEQSAMPAGVFSQFNCSEDSYYESLFWLASERRQAVRILLCRDWALSCHSGRHLTLAEILNVLGSGFTLE